MQIRRSLFGNVAILAAILVAALAALLLVQGAGAPIDVDHYKFWTKLVTQGGVQAAYSGAYPHTYAIYPPLTMYFYWAAGHTYQLLVDPSFELQRALSDPTLTFLVKVPGILFHLLTVTLIYGWLLRRQGQRNAFFGALVYGLSPGVLFDIAVWGQPDPVHSFFVLLSVILLLDGRSGWAGAVYGLAAMTKPQTWVLAPLIFLFVRRSHGFGRASKAVSAAAVAGLTVALPFLIFGTWKQLLGLPASISGVAPWVSANAHNLWWLILGEKAITIADFERTRFGLSWATLGAVLAGLSLLFCLSRLQPGKGIGWRSLPPMLALQSFALFFLMTKAHENHAFMVLPLLSLCWLRDRRMALLYVFLSLTLLLNVLLHDPVVAPQLGTLIAGQLKAVQSLNAAANLVLLLGWAAMTLSRGENASQTFWPKGSGSPGEASRG